MSFVAAPNCVSLGFLYSLDLTPIENTFHYRLPAPATEAHLHALATVGFAWFQAHQASFSSELNFTKIYARALDTANSPSNDYTPTVALPGTNAGAIAPNNVSFAVKRQTGKAGRKMRGRVYWPGIPTGWLETPNTIFQADAVAVVNIMQDLATRMLAATPVATEIILHRADGTHDDVTSYAYTDLFVDSQRRRLPGHNIHH